MIANEIKFEEISKWFRYSDGKLFKLDGRTKTWVEIDMLNNNSSGVYARVTYNGKRLQAHRVIYCLYNREDVDQSLVIDHKDNNPRNNHHNNLQLVSQQINQQGRKSHRQDGKCLGASWEKAVGKWRAFIGVGDKTKFIGYFSSEQDAHAAHKEALTRLENGEVLKSSVEKRAAEGRLKGASFNKRAGKWESEITRKGKKYYLGCFLTEIEAHEAYLAAAEALT